MTQVALADHELTLTGPAQGKMAELMAQVEDNVQGVRVFATPGGCSGVSAVLAMSASSTRSFLLSPKTCRRPLRRWVAVT